MKSKRFFIIFIIAAVAGVALLAYFGLADKFSTRAVPPTAGDKAQAAAGPALERQSVSETADTYAIEIKYPKFSGVAGAGAEKINQDIKTIIQSEIREFKSAAGSGSPVSGIKSELSIGYRQGLLSSKFASLIFDESTDLAGAAHPNFFSITANYDLETGKLITLADIFKPGVKHLDLLSIYARASLKENKGIGSDQKWIDDGTEPTAENFGSYYLAPENLVILFQPYQVAAGAAGTREVKIPLAKIKGELNPRILELLQN